MTRPAVFTSHPHVAGPRPESREDRSQCHCVRQNAFSPMRGFVCLKQPAITSGAGEISQGVIGGRVERTVPVLRDLKVDHKPSVETCLAIVGRSRNR